MNFSEKNNFSMGFIVETRHASSKSERRGMPRLRFNDRI